MIIAIDFDGTCVTHNYPAIGRDIGASKVLKQIVASGHKLILYTMRSGKELDAAVEWFKSHDIPLWAANYNPEQEEWTSSPKVYANLYIDDAALGTPVINNYTYSDRPYVDWSAVRAMLAQMRIIRV